jgi:hypothetical protein
VPETGTGSGRDFQRSRKDGPVIAMTWVLVLLTVAAWTLTVLHLTHLPVAPQCPDCRTVTGQPTHTTALDRLFGLLGNAAARECPRCGWAGRMRWRLAVRRTRSE